MTQNPASEEEPAARRGSNGRRTSNRAAAGGADARALALVAALDALPIGLAIIGADRRLLFQNARGRDILPMPDAMLGSDPLESLRKANQAKPAPDSDTAATPTGHARLETPDGSRCSVAIHALAGGAWLVFIHPAEAVLRDPGHGGPDVLTGLPDRDSFRTSLALAMHDAAMAQAPLSVFHIDIRRFAAINEAFGANLGDAVLRRIAERLCATIEPGAIAARFGGAEFGVCLPGVDADAAARHADWLHEVLGRTYLLDGQVINLRVSIGAATAPVDGRGADALLDKAQIALLRAKTDNAGCRQFEPAMERRLQERRSLEFDLRKALALREFELHYQPQIDIGSGALVGFEALLRWRHAERGMVPPAAFVPLAEELDIIRPIGEWALRAACETAADWPGEVGISVNVSPLQFTGRNLASTVMSALSTTGLAPHRLTLEITESALISDEKLVLETMHQIRALGVKTALDDFGTGYSSMATLSRFPFDNIKIDQSFVRGSTDSPGCDAIVSAMATLGRNLGVPTTAEGVETDEQLRRMRAHGCVHVQGYLTGRPMPAEEARRLIGAGAASGEAGKAVPA